MINQQHPIKPSPELIKNWLNTWYDTKVKHYELIELIAITAAQWGADQELEECCRLFQSNSVCGTKFQRNSSVRDLRNARRPKPKKVSVTVSITGTELEIEQLITKLKHDSEISIKL
jgi:hypothetical protein